MKDWNEVKKDKELIRKVENLVNETGEFPDRNKIDWLIEVYSECMLLFL